jgi:DNA protecting protein DprA
MYCIDALQIATVRARRKSRSEDLTDQDRCCIDALFRLAWKTIPSGDGRDAVSYDDDLLQNTGTLCGDEGMCAMTDFVYTLVAYEVWLLLPPRAMRGAPRFLVWWWDCRVFQSSWLGVVWPRRPSAHGKNLVSRMVEAASDYNLCIVSGGAQGIDYHAHTEAIRFAVPTLVVLWTWLWSLLKGTMFSWLKERVVQSWWAFVSQFSFAMTPKRYTYPARNQTIAWLSKVLYVPEAWQKSWSLITVDFALGMNTYCYGGIHLHTEREYWWLVPYFRQWLILPVWHERDLLDQHFTVLDRWWSARSQEVSWAHDSLWVSLDTQWLCYEEFCELAGRLSSWVVVDYATLLSIFSGDDSRVMRVLWAGELYGILLPERPLHYKRYWRTPNLTA